MILVFKIITGESIIGSIEAGSINDEWINITNPMLIEEIKDEYGNLGMTLSAMLLLSDDELLTFKRNHVITYYNPKTIMVNYYSRMVEYSNNFLDKKISAQIKAAIDDLDSTISDTDNKSIVDFLLKNSNTTLQ
jgi:hypothetical protein